MRFVRTTLMGLTAAMCLVIACDSATAPTPSGIGTEGGTASAANNTATVAIPAGALPANTKVTVTPATDAPASPGLVTSAVYEFGPSGTTFATPVTISIKYDPASLPADVPESSLQMYTLVGTEWTLVPGSSVDVTTHMVTGSTTHFSRYAPMGRPAVATVVLSPPSATLIAGTTLQISAQTLDAARNVLSGRPITWISGDLTRATVSPTGLITAVAPGITVITATSGTRSATVNLEVIPVPVASIVITPTAANLTVGATSLLTAVAKDASGNALAGRAITWTSSDPTKASVSSAGVVSAIAPGTTTISATSEGRVAAAVVTVTQVPIATIAVSPSSLSMFLDAVTTLQATARDASGAVIAGRVVTWATSDASVATVSVSGDVTAKATGTATISASAEGRSASATITVVNPATNITLTPTVASVAVGATTNLSAQPYDAQGRPLGGRPIAWSTLNAGVATVSPSGVVTGVSQGSAIIRAIVDGATATATVTVTSTVLVPVASVSITPATASIVPAGTVQLSAVTADASSNVLTGRTVTWTSSDVTRATVSASGLVTGVAAGNATITATSESKTATAVITVAPAAVATVSITPANVSIVTGATTNLTATLRDAGNNTLTGRPIDWTTSNAAVATVSPSGVVTGITAGAVTIVATSEGRTATAGVTVTLAVVPVAAVSVTPVDPTLNVGSTQQFTATSRDAGSNVLTGRTVTWSSANPVIATVSSTGLVTAVAVGTAAISATVEGIATTSTVTVTAAAPGAVATVSLPASGVPFVAGSIPVQFSALLKDAGGATLSDRAVTWATSDATIATISATGLFTPLQPGTVTITATSEGKSGSATLTVIPPPVAAIAITPATPTVAIGSTQQLTVTLTDANGMTLTGRSITYVSFDAAKATVSAGGLVTAIAAGSVTIQATAEGKTATATISIPTQAPVATLTIAPATITINSGSTTQLVATPRDASNNVLASRVITWSSSDVTKATVSSTGLVISVATGTVTITATSEGKTATSVVTIVVPTVPVASITLTPSSLTIRATTVSAPITATTLDASNQVLTGRTITWTSQNSAIATVSSAGVVTGVAPGSTTIVVASETRSAVLAVTVTSATAAVPVSSVVVTPQAPSVVLNGTVQLTATVLDAAGNVLTGRTILWASTATNAATVTSTGLVTAKRVGTVTIDVSSENIFTTVVLTVTAIPTASVQLLPANQTGVVGGTIALSANALNAQGQVIGNHVITFSSSNTAVATVSSQGTVTGVSAGSAVITATTDDNVSASTNVTFTAGTAPVFTLTVTPATPTVVTGATLQLSANPVDANNTPLTGRAITWSTTNTAVATISTAGLLSAKTVGTVTITVASEGKTASTLVTIVSPPVASVVITPATSSVVLRTAAALTATVKDADGNAIQGHTVTWTSSDANKVFVNSSGQVTANAVGTVTITATSDGKSGTATVNAILAPVTSVVISPALSNLGLGETASLYARTNASTGEVTGRTIVWTTSDAGKATVSSTGVVTATGVGSATITATSESQAGTSVVNVASVTAPTSTALRLQAIATGTEHACGLDAGGAAYCWGSNGNGALGDNTQTNHHTPVAVTGGLTFSSISADANLSCGITGGGTLYCWGGGSQFTPSSSPVSVAPGITFASVSANESHTCGVATDGTGYCAGGNGSGVLGNGQASDVFPGSMTFQKVVGGLKWKQIATSNVSTCGVATTGALYCWGTIGSYTNATGAVSASSSPVLISNAVNFASLTHHIASYIVCGLDTGGAAYCIGSLATEFGAASTTSYQTPRRVGGTLTFKYFSHYSDNVCGVASTDALYCWGNGGALGQGSGGPTSSTTPLVVLPGRTFSTVDISDELSVCAVARDGVGFCWGGNFYGQIGDGTTVSRSVPTTIAGSIVYRVP